MPRISDFQVVERGTQTFLSVKSESMLKNLNTEIEESREKVEAYLQLIDEHPSGPFLVIYHNFSKDKVEMEAGFPVQKELAGEEEVRPATLAAGLYLTALHQGPHKEIPKVYQEMDHWLEENHFETTGVSEEIYYNKKSNTVKEDQLVTMILIPIQKQEK